MYCNFVSNVSNKFFNSLSFYPENAVNYVYFM